MKKVGVDTITEMMTGVDGSIRTTGRMVLMPREPIMKEGHPLSGMSRLLVGGVVVSPHGMPVHPDNRETFEMWAGDFILLPRKKYNPKHSLRGMRIDQLVMHLIMEDCWEEQK